MKFIILEKKDNDCYVIYDAKNGGVCCCSLYTIKQLVERGHEVVGYSAVGGRTKITEHNLDGTARDKKAPNCCEITIKRSAVTIERGLDEKHYPRAKKDRRSTGSIVEVSIKSKVSGSKVKINNVECLEYVAHGIQLSSGAIVTTNNEIIQKDKVLNNPNYDVVISRLSVDAEENKLLKSLFELREKRIEMMGEVEKVNAAIQKKIDKLNEEIKKLEDEKRSKVNKIECNRKEILEEGNNLARSYKYKDVTGKEICSYSFYGARSRDGYVCFDYILEVMKKTTRPFVYTYGLGYRHPTTYRKPITRKQGFEYVKHGMIDITAERDCIHINEFSANDMW